MENLMFTKPYLIIAALTTMAFAPLTARAQDSSALLDLLVKKKIVTEKEAGSLRTELKKGCMDPRRAPVPWPAAAVN